MNLPGSTSSLFAVVGPTTSGKSDLGIALAKAFYGEVVTCDSVQVYRGINIATEKVPLAEQCGIPHHLIDIVEPMINLAREDGETRFWRERRERSKDNERICFSDFVGYRCNIEWFYQNAQSPNQKCESKV